MNDTQPEPTWWVDIDPLAHDICVCAPDAETAAYRALARVGADSPPPRQGTDWWRAEVYDEVGEWVDLIRLAVHPEPPPCSEDEHDWIEGEAWGSGGEALQRDRCTHCEAVRVTDTWATDPTDGTQGLTSIRYEEGL